MRQPVTHRLFTDEENILSEICTWRDLVRTVCIPPTPKNGLSLLCSAHPEPPRSHMNLQLRERWRGCAYTGATHRDHFGQIRQLVLAWLSPQGSSAMVVWGLWRAVRPVVQSQIWCALSVVFWA